ncbi:hypothetical protein E0H80_06440 [Acinetobacter sp. ANC 4779]|uniref:hypothetical protein n=1 Tax=Acinetobacter sp. ANC 4779 TaxID=2529848 RepID=UPI00103B85A9|nr:hypothetical protein [Acinetobacter sp. ANC 4779]TCB51000.1 hypothetical protein E0H80_06440 [Acinetobacter sp. ANC 4779]
MAKVSCIQALTLARLFVLAISQLMAVADEESLLGECSQTLGFDYGNGFGSYLSHSQEGVGHAPSSYRYVGAFLCL